MDQLNVLVDGRQVRLSAPGPHVIGRHSDAAVVVEHESVSRHHLGLRALDGKWWIEDLGSSNGTFLDGSPVTELSLEAPLQVMLGGSTDGITVDLVPVTADPADLGPSGLGRPLRVHGLGGDRVTIGRADDNTVVLNDLQVSRHHAELLRRDDRSWLLSDLDSYNGTFVEGERVEGTRLISDEVISIGSRFLRVGGSGIEEYSAVEHFPVAAEDLRVVTPDGSVLLDDISFVVEEASMMAILGPSGAGKSTLLGALTGLAPATSGRVLCGGRDLYAMQDSLSRRIGYVPQDDLVQPELTVEQSVDYAAKLRFPPDVSQRERDERVDEVIAELGLEHRRDVRVGDLSGGQRKRVSIALELLTRPSLVYLDEPTSGLDPGYERSVMMMLRRLADSGRTVVLVTHSVESLYLCDRVLCLAPGGRTAWYGPPEEMPRYFERQSYQEIFQLLDSRGALDHAAAEGGNLAVDPAELRDRYEASTAAQRYVRAPLESYEQALAVDAPEEATVRRGPALRHWFGQVGTLTRRYAQIMRTDRRTLTVLAITGPVLGLVLLLRLPPAQLGGPDATQPLFSQAAVISFILVIGITQVATSTSAREIVKERAILSRERTVGVFPSAYLVSKVVVLGGIAVAQAVVIIGIATARQRGPTVGIALGSGRMELFAVGALVALGAMAAGLLLSALVDSPDRVALILPAILGFHVLVTAGEVMPSVPRVPVLEQARYLSTARWGYAAMASTVDVEDRGAPARVLGELSGMTLEELGSVQSIEDLEELAPIGEDLRHRSSVWWRDVAAIAGLTALMLAATAVVLRRKGPSA